MTYIPDRFRQEIRNLAHHRCEYCLYDERASENPHEIDHIIATQHGGDTVVENLCLACFECNRQKGPNLCSLDSETKALVALFNPRRHQWTDHFRLDGAHIVPLTPEGRVTVRVLNINDSERINERERLMRIGRYPQFREA
jgi:hypothetical protein